jgi:hypothetical protein
LHSPDESAHFEKTAQRLLLSCRFADETVVLDDWKAGLKQEAMKSGETITGEQVLAVCSCVLAGHLRVVQTGSRS